MPAARVPDAEFIELWRTHKSAHKLSKILDVAPNMVYQRRRAIEQRYHIRLEAAGPQGEIYKHLSPVEHAAKLQLKVRDGTVIVFSDAHFWPHVRTTAFKALLMFIREFAPVAVINNGDAFDGASISRHERIMFLDAGPSVLHELQCCKERLGEIEDIAGTAKLYWPLGNHDARFESRLAANAPQYEGVTGFHLKDHFPAWSPCWLVEINDDVVCKHRWKNGIHAAHNNTVGSGKTLVTSHLHSLKVTPYTDYRGTRWGVDTGTLSDPQGPQFVDYTEGNPTNWRSGFIVLTFENGELLDPEMCRVRGPGEVVFRGRVFNVTDE
jgi:hypothetical protein